VRIRRGERPRGGGVVELRAGVVMAPRPEPSAVELAALRQDLTPGEWDRLRVALGVAVALVLGDDE